MPEWVYIVFAVIIGGGAIMVLIRGGTFSFFKQAAVFHVNGKTRSPKSPVSQALEFISNNAQEVRHVVYGGYLRALKHAGVPEELLAECDDGRFVLMLLRVAVNGGNGTESVQKVIEREVVAHEWKPGMVESYVKKIILPLVTRTLINYLNSEYDSRVFQADGTWRDRVVSKTMFFDLIKKEETQEAMFKALLPMFTYANDCLVNGCRNDD